MRTETKNKYYTFLMALYEAKEFDIKHMMREHQVSTRLVTLLREHRMITRNGKLTQWIAQEPTQFIANTLAKESLKIARISKLQNQSAPQQLTIKPIKRVERTHPVPVKEEPIHDTSNSKMFIVLAVGAMVGFLIATIIWK